MFKLPLASYAEMQAFVKSVSCLRQSIVAPVYLCHQCQHQLARVKTRRNHSQSLARYSNVTCITGVYSPPYTLHKKSVTWQLCFNRHSSTKPPPTTDGDQNSNNVTGSTPSSKAPGGQQVFGPDPKVLSSTDTKPGTSGEGPDVAAEVERKKNKLLSVIPRMRKPNPIDYSYTGNIYILPRRAVMEYLLKPSDLVELPKYTRRSPYDDGTRITLYLRSDVEEVALKKWGDFDKLNKEKAKIRSSDSLKNFDITDIRMLLGEMHSSSGFVNPDDPNTRNINDGATPSAQPKEPTFWSSGSTKVVLSAVLVNGANTLTKLIAWLYTGSHSMFSEFVHSFADTMNQIVLGFGLYHSFKKPDTDHPYGYRNLRHISSLISGVGIFFFGTGLSYYHSLQGFLHPTELGNLTWCVATLIGSLISEGATLLIAINQVKKSSQALNMGFKEYCMRGVDPNVNVVLLEDFAAVLGVGIAGICITVSALTGSSLADAAGSALIGTLLGSVAAFIIHQNTHQLVGRSIPETERQEISQWLERDRMIRSLHDIKATMMGGVVRYKAEVDFDGREITRAYLYKQDMDLMLAEVQKLKTVEDLEVFMMNHGEKIIDELGAEVDRIEKALKSQHPEIRHVDLEAL
ncbi:unnamed protein product [Lymnaea stagnalis]|uniref:Proton-coupled zinc antiporter SLC30A9, mitochondrial n=1 Tax=Lymnaea stagnalis TaxID=6523 RepID=A0AAV2HFA2_LYMST